MLHSFPAQPLNRLVEFTGILVGYVWIVFIWLKHFIPFGAGGDGATIKRRSFTITFINVTNLNNFISNWCWNVQQNNSALHIRHIAVNVVTYIQNYLIVCSLWGFCYVCVKWWNWVGFYHRLICFNTMNGRTKLSILTLTKAIFQQLCLFLIRTYACLHWMLMKCVHFSIIKCWAPSIWISAIHVKCI